MTSRKDKRIIPLFLLHLSRDELSQKIYKLRALFHFRVNIEPHRPPKKTTRCFKCQNFLNHANFCFLDPKCVCCDEEQDSYSCSRKNAKNTDTVTKPTCTNCNEDHPASYRGCKKFPEKIPKKSYAKAVQNRNISSNTNNTENIHKTSKSTPIQKMAPPIYHDYESGNAITTFLKCWQKLKMN